MLELNKERKLVDSYVVFDLETTGLEPKLCEIIEIGALKYKDNKLVEEFSVLIKPKNSISSEITKITGISNEMVKDAPSIEEVLPKFIDFIEELPLVAHNSSFDLSFIEENIKVLGLEMIKNTNIDTVELARKYIPRAYNYKLTTLKNYFKLEYGSHRSIDDCRTTNYVYEYCKKEALVKN
ncbi:MAG: exonuclease domain-containing protein [Ruminococcus sp.]|nr:exonuclease domain-containing protein [Ruminococcus sp.]